VIINQFKFGQVRKKIFCY